MSLFPSVSLRQIESSTKDAELEIHRGRKDPFILLDRRGVMEDGLTKDEIMAAGAPDLSPRVMNLEGPKKENSQGVEEEATGTAEEREDAGGGFLSHIIPNLIHEKRTVEETEDEAAMRRIRETSIEDGPSHVTEDERGGEGVISRFITNLVSSPSPRPGGGQTDIAEGAELDEEPGRNRDGGEPSEAEVSSGNSGGGGGGGVIGSIISSILQHPTGSGGEEAGKEKSVVGGGGSEEGTEEGVSGGGGIVGNIVAHFSASLPEDAAPTTDEASILLHSIVKD